MDRGIWAAWYDLPEDGADEYINWLHEVHLLQALKRPGYLWAAHIDNVKTGSGTSTPASRIRTI